MLSSPSSLIYSHTGLQVSRHRVYTWNLITSHHIASHHIIAHHVTSRHSHVIYLSSSCSYHHHHHSSSSLITALRHHSSSSSSLIHPSFSFPPHLRPNDPTLDTLLPTSRSSAAVQPHSPSRQASCCIPPNHPITQSPNHPITQ